MRNYYTPKDVFLYQGAGADVVVTQVLGGNRVNVKEVRGGRKWSCVSMRELMPAAAPVRQKKKIEGSKKSLVRVFVAAAAVWILMLLNLSKNGVFHPPPPLLPLSLLNRTEWATSTGGFTADSGTIHTMRATVEAARRWCDARKNCIGFTLRQSHVRPAGGEDFIVFKREGSTRTTDPDWVVHYKRQPSSQSSAHTVE